MRNINFLEYRKVAYVISVVVLLLGAAAIFNGFNQGVEFKGGRSYIVKFHAACQTEKVGDDLQKVFGKYPVIKTYGGNNQLDITTDYLINNQVLKPTARAG